MNIVLTGGTGFVGRAVTAELVRRGHRVRRLVRTMPAAAPGRVEDVVADLAESAPLVPLLRGQDAVVHLVGIISECGPQTFERVHVGVTRSVLEAARAAGVPRWVHMSALGTRPGAASRYHQTKWAAEEL
ncbi:MAG TPA: NAD(P)H-binding protein, partial [Verrucomicrobiota bacterium]|nr:NAD(P)H-binding protein [Verrucomicrobiota bacterium]